MKTQQQPPNSRQEGVIPLAALDFGSLSFEDAVRLFKKWGFTVEPGPRPEEVTLILEGPSHKTYSVHDARALPDMAAVALAVRWQNQLLDSCAARGGGAQLLTADAGPGTLFS